MPPRFSKEVTCFFGFGDRWDRLCLCGWWMKEWGAKPVVTQPAQVQSGSVQAPTGNDLGSERAFVVVAE